MEKNCKRGDISIAVFDSGIGGLNLLKECALALPDVNLYYLADNYNVPYGDKSADKIFALVKNAFSLVADIDLSAAVIACNTATSNCVDRLRGEYSFPIIGIQPAVRPAAREGGRCLVLATPSTVKSASFCKLLSDCKNDRTEFTISPCPCLAEYIEEHAEQINFELPKGLLPDIKADSVVLGCTHYVFAKRQIKETYNCKIFDGIEGTTARLREKLGIADHSRENPGIFDHQALNRANITFLGGNFIKNAKIFDKMTHGL